MNTVLTSLIPGAREFRTPLAVGVLWSLAAFLGYRLAPEPVSTHIKTFAQTFTIGDLSEAKLILGGLASFGVYLVGVVALLVTGNLARVVRALIVKTVFRNVCIIVAAVATASAVVAFPQVAATILLWTLVASGVLFLAFVLLPTYIYWQRTYRSKEVPYLHLLRETLSEIFWSAPASYRRHAESIATAWNPARRQARYFMDQDTLRRVDASPSLLNSLIRELEAWETAQALCEADVPYNVDSAPALLRCDATTWFELSQRLRPWRVDPMKTNSASENWLHNCLSEAIDRDPALRPGFVRQYVRLRTDIHAADSERRIQAGEVRLKLDHSTLYDDYDRLKSECEFRGGVAVPLGLTVALTWMLVDKEFELSRALSRHTAGDLHTFPTIVGLAIAAVLALITGRLLLSASRARSDDASRLLYSAMLETEMTPVESGYALVHDFNVGHRRRTGR